MPVSSWEQAPQPPAAGLRTDAAADPPGGTLRPHREGQHTPRRYDAPPTLAPYVEWIWAVDWDLTHPLLRPAPVLSHPAINATLEGPVGRRHGQDLPAALVHGVVSRRFDTTLEGRGWVVGVRFRPGGYAALADADAAALTDRVERWSGRPTADEALQRALTATDEPGRVAAVIQWWQDILDARHGGAQEPDATYLVVRSLVEDVAADRALTDVEDLAERHGLSVPSVQRLIRWYTGVPPTWLIRRYRVQDALATLQAERDTDLVALATSLGWYDQAQFTGDFRAVVGRSPATYLPPSNDAEQQGP